MSESAVTSKAAAAAVAPTFRPKRLAVAAGIALVANLIAFALGGLANASWMVGQPYPINAVAVAAATVIALAVGGVGTWLISRWRPGFTKVAAWLGFGFAILSMASLLNAADLATGLGLGSMHLMTALAWLFAVLPKKSSR